MPSCVLLPIDVALSGVFVDFGLVCAVLLCGVLTFQLCVE
jgi:hypothetical protein